MFFNFIDTSYFGIPELPGVYAVCVNHCPYDTDIKHERILYIGSSKNMNSRLASLKHPYRICYDRLENFAVYTRCYPTEFYAELEMELIKVYKPILNKRGK